MTHSVADTSNFISEKIQLRAEALGAMQKACESSLERRAAIDFLAQMDILAFNGGSYGETYSFNRNWARMECRDVDDVVLVSGERSERLPLFTDVFFQKAITYKEKLYFADCAVIYKIFGPDFKPHPNWFTSKTKVAQIKTYSRRVIIEVDGQYYHDSPSAMIRDHEKNTVYAALNCRVFRFSEDDLLGSSVRISSILRDFIESEIAELMSQ